MLLLFQMFLIYRSKVLLISLKYHLCPSPSLFSSFPTPLLPDNDYDELDTNLSSSF